MARPRSEDKRNALLDAATRFVAERGLSAPTPLIAQAADVSEGTLFRYFPTKEVLLNELYLHLNRLMCDELAHAYPADASLRERAQTLWNSYIDWGMAHPLASKALNQLAVSEVIKPQTRATADHLLADVGLARMFSNNQAFEGRPVEFADAIFLALADATITFASREPEQADAYKTSGFSALWRMIEPD